VRTAENLKSGHGHFGLPDPEVVTDLNHVRRLFIFVAFFIAIRAAHLKTSGGDMNVGLAVFKVFSRVG
jgi:hypothetical protein